MTAPQPAVEKGPAPDDGGGGGISPSPSAPDLLDDTYNVYKQTEGLDAGPDEEARVLRKIDLRIVPILLVTYMLQYLDKNSINFAVVFGLQEGTHMTGQDYCV